ncbi:unnamed protein product [Ixodes pacificus]
MLASPEDEPSTDDERPTTVQQLKGCFLKSGIDVDSPCTATTALDSTSTVGQCWVLRSLVVWNRFLHANGIELVEDLPNRLKVQTFVSYPLRDKDYHAVSAFLVSRLLNDHPCVHSVELNHVSTLFGRETEAFDNVATNQGIEKITLADEGKLQRKSKLKAHKLISTLVGGNLRSIRLDSMYLFNIPRKALCDALASSSRLVELFLCDNGLTADGTIDILSALMASTTLTCLSLDNNNVASRGACFIAKLLKTNAPLVTLSLNKTRLGPKGTAYVAEALEANKTLQVLKLGWNNLPGAGTCRLCKALKTNSTLLHLDLQGNYFRDEDGIAIAEMLKCNRSLQELNLRSSVSDNSSMLAIADALLINRSLVRLSLGGYIVAGEGVEALVRSLEVNNTLTKLSCGELSCYMECVQFINFINALALNRPLVELETVLAHLVAVRQLSHVLQFHPTLRRLSVKNVRPYAIGDMAQLFTALIWNTTLQELEARGLQSVNEIECLASLIARTSSIRSVTLDVCPSCTNYLVTVMRGLSHNNSIWRFECSIKKLTVPLSEEIAYMLTKNSTLSHLLLNDAVAGEDCLMTLANAMDLNRSLQQLGVNYPTASFAGICIRGCLRRNASVMARAVDFALRKVADKKSAQAFELHQKNEHFIQKLTLVAGTGPQVEALIAGAKWHIRHNFFALAEIVKEELVCLDFPDSECATGIDQLNQYCLFKIVSYLKISDVKD